MDDHESNHGTPKIQTEVDTGLQDFTVMRVGYFLRIWQAFHGILLQNYGHVSRATQLSHEANVMFGIISPIKEITQLIKPTFSLSII